MFKYIGIRGHRGAGKNTISYLLGVAIDFYLRNKSWVGFDEVYNQAENPNFQKYFAEFMLNDSCHKTKTGNNVIKRSAMIPTPGCRQYDSFPVVMNKEDFE